MEDNRPEEEQEEHPKEEQKDQSEDSQPQERAPLSPAETPVAPQGGEERQWYVVRVQSGREDRVKSNLEQRVIASGMSDKISTVLVPTELVSEIKKGSRRTIVKRKLYPGYVMVEMCLSEETHFVIKSTPGVGDIAGKMSDNEVERLFLTCDHAKDKPKPKVSFEKGQVIKIKEGAFENYDGIVDEVNEQKGVIKVRIEIFGRSTQVELGYWQVESI